MVPRIRERLLWLKADTADGAEGLSSPGACCSVEQQPRGGGDEENHNKSHKAQRSSTSSGNTRTDHCCQHLTPRREMPQQWHQGFGKEPEHQWVLLESSPLLLHRLHLPFSLPLSIFIHLGIIFTIFPIQFLVNYSQGLGRAQQNEVTRELSLLLLPTC